MGARFARRSLPALVSVVGLLLVLAGCTAMPPSTPAAGTAAGPEYGIYWYGKEDASQKAIPGRPNLYYDPTKPTMLFIHGWQPDQAYTHRTLMWEYEDATTGEMTTFDLAAPWIDAGWNIGVFDWGPFADESNVMEAEAKIWTARGPRGMRWRDRDGNYQTEGAPQVSASELLFRTYMDVFADYRGPEIRAAGHSMGNQMATALVENVLETLGRGEVSPHLLPDRLTLLDPYWSPPARDFLNQASTGDVVRRGIQETMLHEGILVEWYRSSSLTDGTLISDGNTALQSSVVFSEMQPQFCPLTQQVCKHEASWQQYLLSFGSAPPLECERAGKDAACVATGRAAALASTPNERLADMLADDATWIQAIGPDGVDGRLTPITSDDWYERVPTATTSP